MATASAALILTPTGRLPNHRPAGIRLGEADGATVDCDNTASAHPSARRPGLNRHCELPSLSPTPLPPGVVFEIQQCEKSGWAAETASGQCGSRPIREFLRRTPARSTVRSVEVHRRHQSPALMRTQASASADLGDMQVPLLRPGSGPTTPRTGRSGRRPARSGDVTPRARARSARTRSPRSISASVNGYRTYPSSSTLRRNISPSRPACSQPLRRSRPTRCSGTTAASFAESSRRPTEPDVIRALRRRPYGRSRLTAARNSTSPAPRTRRSGPGRRSKRCGTPAYGSKNSPSSPSWR